MKGNPDMLKSKKTYVTGVMTILAAIAAYLIGEAELGVTIQLVVTAVMAMTIRHGVTTETAKKLVIGFLCVGMLVAFQPRQAEAHPLLGVFALTALTGGWTAFTYEECLADALDAEECAKRTWVEREGVPITQKIYNESFNN